MNPYIVEFAVETPHRMLAEATIGPDHPRLGGDGLGRQGMPPEVPQGL